MNTIKNSPLNLRPLILHHIVEKSLYFLLIIITFKWQNTSHIALRKNVVLLLVIGISYHSVVNVHIQVLCIIILNKFCYQIHSLQAQIRKQLSVILLFHHNRKLKNNVFFVLKLWLIQNLLIMRVDLLILNHCHVAAIMVFLEIYSNSRVEQNYQEIAVQNVKRYYATTLGLMTPTNYVVSSENLVFF